MKIFKHPVILETACGHDGSEEILKNLQILQLLLVQNK